MRSTNKVAVEFDDAWILHRRPQKNAVVPDRPYAHSVEPEHSSSGLVEDVATVFLTNKECPFRCLMCDLWKNTTDTAVAPGAIPAQIRWALDRLTPAKHIKLYNSGNFFDPQAIPVQDYRSIAEIVSSFETVVVESHPRMVGRRCLEFNEMLPTSLQVAMGLETVHPEVLPRLNKRMTLDDFAKAAGLLRAHDIDTRAFILLRPPFLSEAEGVCWAKRSLDFAFDVGVECCTIIPTRGGNGALESLAERGLFEPPTLDSLEEVLLYGVELGRGRVFADLWDVEKPSHQGSERNAVIERLRRINLAQRSEPGVK